MSTKTEEALLPIDPHDHPESQVMVWSELELHAIRKYAARCVESALAASAGAEQVRPVEPVAWQWRRLLGNPRVIEPFWTEWEFCSKAQYEFALANPDHEARELGVIEPGAQPAPAPAEDRAALAAAIRAFQLTPVAEVGDLVIQKREQLQSRGWRNRETLITETKVRALLDAAAALVEGREG